MAPGGNGGPSPDGRSHLLEGFPPQPKKRCHCKGFVTSVNSTLNWTSRKHFQCRKGYSWPADTLYVCVNEERGHLLQRLSLEVTMLLGSIHPNSETFNLQTLIPESIRQQGYSAEAPSY